MNIFRLIYFFIFDICVLIFNNYYLEKLYVDYVFEEKWILLEILVLIFYNKFFCFFLVC